MPYPWRERSANRAALSSIVVTVLFQIPVWTAGTSSLRQPPHCDFERELALPLRPPSSSSSLPVERRSVRDCLLRLRVVADHSRSTSVRQSPHDVGWAHKSFRPTFPRRFASNPLGDGCLEKFGGPWFPPEPRAYLSMMPRGLAVFEGIVVSIDDGSLMSTGDTVWMADMLERLGVWRPVTEKQKSFSAISSGSVSIGSVGMVGLSTLRFAEIMRLIKAARLDSEEQGWKEAFEWYDYPQHFARNCGISADSSVPIVRVRQLLTSLKFISKNYYHFTADTLAGLALLVDAQQLLAGVSVPAAAGRSPSHVPGLLAYDFPFVRGALDLLGVNAESVLYYDPCVAAYMADDLFFPSGLSMSHPSRESLLYARRALVPSALLFMGALPQQGRDDFRHGVILVDRRDKVDKDRDAKERAQLRNFAAIEAVVREAAHVHLGAKTATLRLANMPLSAQVMAFARAAHLVGAEGAGLSNTIYLAVDEQEVSVARRMGVGALPAWSAAERACSVVSLTPWSFSCGVSYIWRLADSVGCEFVGFRVKGWDSLHRSLYVAPERLTAFLAELWAGPRYQRRVRVGMPDSRGEEL